MTTACEYTYLEYGLFTRRRDIVNTHKKQQPCKEWKKPLLYLKERKASGREKKKRKEKKKRRRENEG
jgi:hypothetical protein